MVDKGSVLFFLCRSYDDIQHWISNDHYFLNGDSRGTVVRQIFFFFCITCIFIMKRNPVRTCLILASAAPLVHECGDAQSGSRNVCSRKVSQTSVCDLVAAPEAEIGEGKTA